MALADEQTPLLPPAVQEAIINTSTSPKAINGTHEHLISHTTDGDIENGPAVSPKRTTSKKEKSEKSVAGIITVLLIGVFVANADGTLVLASYGKIASEFHDLENASWLVTSYTLAMSALQPLYGKLSDIYGRTRMILIAYTLFGIGCAISALGRSLSGVVAGRVVSGLGGAGMDSLVSILITDLVPPRDIGSWRAYVNIIATTGRALGGPVGGFLADSIGWQWSFLGQCPLTFLAILSTWLKLPNRVPTHSSTSPEGDSKSKLSRIDFAGSFLLASTILLFLLPLELASERFPWTHPLILGLFVAAGVLCVSFVVVESYWAIEPIFAIRFLRSRSVIVPNIVMFFQTAAQLGMMYTVPIYFQVTQDATSALAGAHLFPAVAGVAVAGVLGGYLVKRTGKYKRILNVATISSSTSYLLLFLRWHGHTSWLESLYIVPGGFGNGLVQSAAFVALTASIEPAQVAMACSTFFLSSNTGSVVGIAATSAVIQSTLREGLRRQLRGNPNRDLIIKQATSSIEFIRSLEPDVKTIVTSVYTQSLRYSHLVNLSCAIIAFIASCFIKEYNI